MTGTGADCYAIPLCQTPTLFFGLEPTCELAKSREARGRICVFERWDSANAQTTRGNQMMPESVSLVVNLFTKKRRSCERLFTFFKFTTTKETRHRGF